MQRVLVYSDGHGPIEVDRPTLDVRHTTVAPSREHLDEADLVFVLAPLKDGDQAIAAGGRLKLAIESGTVVLFCYAARPSEIELRLLRQLLPVRVGGQHTSSLVSVEDDDTLNSIFRDYFIEYGQTAYAFTTYPEGEILARARIGTLRTPYPAAFTSSIGSGRLYVVPLHMASGFQDSAEALIAAVKTHREAFATEPPSFLSELSLPGEEALNTKVFQLTEELHDAYALRDSLWRHKLLLSNLSDSSYESLVIAEINLVLEGSDFRAKDTIERYAEDFEIVGHDARILAEAKALRRNVTYSNVDQLDHHRTALLAPEDEDELGPAPTDTPGLLVANVFRNDDTVVRRRDEAVHENVVKHARRKNVLILRSWDLYSLVVRHLSGKGEGARLAESLEAGGGWLEVGEKSLKLHK